MNLQQRYDFARISRAIEYIRDNFKHQPSLEDVAQEVAMSPSHLQRMFTEWAGVSPKKFLQYVSVEYAKETIRETSLAETAHRTGLSGTGRLHDLFISIEGMTPGEYRSRGEGLYVNYSFKDGLFGEMIVASTHKGICHMGFADDPAEALTALKAEFPKAKYRRLSDPYQEKAMSVFSRDWNTPEEIKLHLKGTDFQLKVWETLLKIPEGGLMTYGDIASYLEKPESMRTVGTAIGCNPVALLIPCHRVIRASGDLGGYRWGSDRKAAIIGWEAAGKDIRTGK